MYRTNVKPRGYAGDSVMMRMIYENHYMGTSTFAKIMHKHPIEHPAAQAVRTRRRLIAQMVHDRDKNGENGQNGKLNVLSVACGPAYEIHDIFTKKEDCDKYNFTLLDQDNAALTEAAELISQVEKKLGSKIDVDFLNESVRTMLATPQISNKWGEYNYIYSMGLFDYLTPPAARAVLAKLLQMLKPGGEMVIGNFHVSNPSRYYMEYWLDWVLYYRSEEDFMDLITDADSIDASVFFENTGSQMFLHVKKHG
jgi:extracellular factor (EF) 3-hydroxypalmitic acid methyl ester biosynthesis protein